MAELKPCPFCGNEGTLVTRYLNRGKMVAVLCQDCGASARAFLTEDYFIEDEAERKAIEAWNRRAEKCTK